jgi:DNA polymerase-3 subunit alpha
MAGHKITVAGMINWVRQIYTKNGKPMAFVEVEDMHGTIEVIVFPRIYEDTHEMWQEEKMVVVRGKVDIKGGNSPKIICERVDDSITHAGPDSKPIQSPTLFDESSYGPSIQPTPPGSQPQHHLQITVHRSGDSDRDRQQLRSAYELVISYEGNDTFSFFIPNGQRRLQLDFPNSTTRNCVELQQRLTEMLGATAVRVEPCASQVAKQ